MEARAIIDLGTYWQVRGLMGAEFMKQAVDTYSIETAGLIQSLRESFTSGDPVIFRRLACAIKSVSAGLGALAVAQEARQLELLGKAKDLTSAGPLVDRLEADFLQVLSCLEGLIENESG